MLPKTKYFRLSPIIRITSLTGHTRQPLYKGLALEKQVGGDDDPYYIVIAFIRLDKDGCPYFESVDYRFIDEVTIDSYIEVRDLLNKGFSIVKEALNRKE